MCPGEIASSKLVMAGSEAIGPPQTPPNALPMPRQHKVSAGLFLVEEVKTN